MQAQTTCNKLEAPAAQTSVEELRSMIPRPNDKKDMSGTGCFYRPSGLMLLAKWFLITETLFVLYEHELVVCETLISLHEHLFISYEPMCMLYEHLLFYMNGFLF